MLIRHAISVIINVGIDASLAMNKYRKISKKNSSSGRHFLLETGKLPSGSNGA